MQCHEVYMYVLVCPQWLHIGRGYRWNDPGPLVEGLPVQTSGLLPLLHAVLWESLAVGVWMLTLCASGKHQPNAIQTKAKPLYSLCNEPLSLHLSISPLLHLPMSPGKPQRFVRYFNIGTWSERPVSAATWSSFRCLMEIQLNFVYIFIQDHFGSKPFDFLVHSLSIFCPFFSIDCFWELWEHFGLEPTSLRFARLYPLKNPMHTVRPKKVLQANTVQSDGD